MEKKKALSGAAKRKKKSEELQDIKKHHKTISSFFVETISGEQLDKSVSIDTNLVDLKTYSTNTDNSNRLMHDVLHRIPQPQSASNSDIDENEIISNKIVSSYHPSDIGNYEEVLTNDLKKSIINMGPSRPPGPFPKDTNKRSFSEYFYKNNKVENFWLCYSNIKNVVYCQPCWLFENNDHSAGWSKGINDWQGLSKRIKTHSQSMRHINACLTYEKWREDKTIDKDALDQINKERDFWTSILERLFDITRTLAKNCLAFRGHSENINATYNGNFLSIVKLVARYDSVLKTVIEKPKGSIKYLSHSIQSEIIDCISKNIKDNIINEIKSATYYSVIIDTTQDISKQDQLSITIRYVHVHEVLNDFKVEIKECFLGFFKVNNYSAEKMTDFILNIIITLGLDIKNCRGQGYDGASVMSGPYSGIQKRIKDINKSALYVHCAAHNLNLVVQDAVNGINEVSKFFEILQDLYTFFGHSIKRWDLLSSFSGDSELTLKKLNPTRWASRVSSILAVKNNFTNILKSLTKISLISKNKHERDHAQNLIKNIDNFEFVFLLVFLSEVLVPINKLSAKLQCRQLELLEVLTLLQEVELSLKYMRDSFLNIKEKAENTARKWGTNTEFNYTRPHAVKRFFDEKASDYHFSNREEKFKINVFFRTLDILNSQICNRFENLRTVVSKFHIIFPENLKLVKEEEILAKASELQELYANDILPCFKNQLLMFRQSFLNEITNSLTVSDLLKLCYKYPTLLTSFSEVIKLLKIFCTMPVTVANAERSFSTLKLIKNYLRSTMCENRLSNLAVIAINGEEADKLPYQLLIKNFAALKSRRKSFKY